MSEIQFPIEWNVVQIAEILALQDDGKIVHQGWSPQCEREPASTDEWGVLKTTAIQDGFFLDNEHKKLPTTKLPKPRLEVKAGDLLVTNAGPRSRCGIICLVKNTRNKLMISGKMYRLRLPASYINSSFIEAWLRTSFTRNELNKRKTGISESGLNMTQVRFLTLPVPVIPLAEQKIIAEKLDTLLAQVDSTKARLEQIPQILKRFRQAVLATAVNGDLTAEWRMNNSSNIVEEEIEKIKNILIAKKIVKKDLTYFKLDRKYQIPSGWLYVKLQSIATKITDGEHKTPKRESAGQLLISARNIQDGYLKLSDVDYVSDAEFQKLRNRCDPDSGDVLISCSGSIGRVCLVDENSKYVMVRSVALIKLMQDFVINKYMMYLLQSPLLQKEIEENSKSTAQANLFLGPIKNLGIPLPPVPEQAEIVRRVEQLFAYADTIEKQVNNALNRVNSLTQSILAKAFRGELTAQWRAENPELISGENSAAALLEKIKAERAASGGKKTSRKKA
ncbi:restriction endonuclease subunit S [Cronobacter malonaticus]|uniref:restriction endonuclease subunit S n=1 Tax=Cronobacter malonaticus TaxID=413503 RepID=UPI000CFCCBD5|nr:restriction endonuclease subunit S [Cronobacter malonaticus]ELY2621655.1 restriction endonuclease subunit S [Cronobacter malonaticus]ELY3623912.1 restriction endonuclease subunit S [Cronobacter malonaticus]